MFLLPRAGRLFSKKKRFLSYPAAFLFALVGFAGASSGARNRPV
jgi:hypothetical protein